MSALITEPGPLHANDWRRSEVWEGGGEAPPDETLAEFTAYYEKPGSDWRGSITYYVEPCKTTNQPVVRDAFHVEAIIQTWRDDERGSNDIDYDYGSPYFYETEEEATAVARRLVLRDEAEVFCA